MKRSTETLIVVAVILLWPTLALADADKPLTIASYNLIDTLSSILLAVAIGLATKFWAWMSHKKKIEVPLQWQGYVDTLIHKGINYAEEFVHMKVKAGTSKAKLPHKLDLAVDFILKNTQDTKLLEKGREWLEDMVLAQLGMHRPSPTPVTAPATDPATDLVTSDGAPVP